MEGKERWSYFHFDECPTYKMYTVIIQYMLKRDGDILRERWSYFDEAASANNFLLSSFANTVPLYFALFANNAFS